MVCLGLLERRQGDLGEARHWYEQAIGTGHPDQAATAMVGLGILETEQGDLGQARQWYRQAIGTSHAEYAPMAMVNLGNLEAGHGDLGQARHWYQQAIAIGHAGAVLLAQQELRALDRHEDERRRGERFGRYGCLAYADLDLMNQGEQNPETSDPAVTDHACEPDHDDGPTP